MNTLILDFGNTHQKAAIVDNGKIIFFSKYSSFDLKTLSKIEDEYDFERVILSSVIKEDTLLDTYLHYNYYFLKLSEDTPLPIRNRYNTPHTLGYDRIACAVAANHLFTKKNVLSIQMGTCITYDFINAKNEYVGGSISPGLQMRYDALNHYTQQLPLLTYQVIDYLSGTTTETCIHSGVINGIINECKGIIHAYRTQYPDIEIILTGGDMRYFEKKLIDEINTYPNLVILGLSLILNYNAQYKNQH